MVITANLEVSRPENDGDNVEKWEAIGLVSAPSVGDVLQVHHDHTWHLLRVERVVHNTVGWPLKDDETGKLGRQKPYLTIIADWITIDLTMEVW